MPSRSAFARLALLALVALMVGCAGRSEPPLPNGSYKLGKPYRINGKLYRPYYDPDYDVVGEASWYGYPFHGRRTANGEIFDKEGLTAAHPTMPLPSLVEVTNLETGRSLVVRVNDRGPFRHGRVIDLSQAAARELGFEHAGLAEVRVRFVELADAKGTPPAPTVRLASAEPPRTAVRVAAVPPPVERRPVGPAPATLHCGTTEIQVGAFADRARAQALGADLAARGFGSVRVDPGPASALAKVRVATQAAAAPVALARLEQLGFADAFVVGAGAGVCT